MARITRKPKLSVFERNQLKVARQVVNMPKAAIPFSGFKGTKEDARAIVKRLTAKTSKKKNSGNPHIAAFKVGNVDRKNVFGI